MWFSLICDSREVGSEAECRASNLLTKSRTANFEGDTSWAAKEESMAIHRKLRIVILGDKGVGKTGTDLYS